MHQRSPTPNYLAKLQFRYIPKDRSALNKFLGETKKFENQQKERIHQNIIQFIINLVHKIPVEYFFSLKNFKF